SVLRALPGADRATARRDGLRKRRPAAGVRLPSRPADLFVYARRRAPAGEGQVAGARLAQDVDLGAAADRADKTAGGGPAAGAAAVCARRSTAPGRGALGRGA